MSETTADQPTTCRICGRLHASLQPCNTTAGPVGGITVQHHPIGSLHSDKAEIRRLRADNERLREAMAWITGEAYAAQYEPRSKLMGSLSQIHHRARAALEEDEG